MRIIISGGGTGGHIFPALAIADAIKAKVSDADILFVGASDRMEMQRVPEAGYKIVGLPVRGFIRPLWSPKNIGVLADYLKSRRMVKKIIKEFKPQAAVGVGGYASGATLDAAHKMGIPCLIQEQNSYAGVTNRMLAGKADIICVAYEGMERFFPKEKILLTGNPVRKNLMDEKTTRREAAGSFHLEAGKKTILILGGSLGARTINESVLLWLRNERADDIQLIWQTGGYYFSKIKEQLKGEEERLCVTPFISDMAKAYAAADLVVSRAGAGSISEFCLLGKAVILVPSPNVAEDHQTKNAMALVRGKAAVCVKDSEAGEKLMPTAVATVRDERLLRQLAEGAGRMALPNAAGTIADEVIKLTEKWNSKI